MNGLSEYSKPKVDQAFDSLDITFSTKIVPSEFTKTAADEREKHQDGQGDSIEELEGILTSILPNLKINMESGENGSQTMTLRISKVKFEKILGDMIPLFIRILTQKDQEQKYGLVLTSYVRDPLNPRAENSLNIIKDYSQKMVAAGLPSYRVSNVISKGNPAMLAISFEPYQEAQ